MSRLVKTQAALAIASLCAAAPVLAQSSVTLYGVVDNSLSYQSSQGSLGSTARGDSAVKMANGVWVGSRFGVKGNEDLGGGNKAIFNLESRFGAPNGSQQFTNAMFGGQAWVGLSSPTYGSATFGRQYTAYYTLLSPYSPTNWTTGFYGAHAGDLDQMDTIYRVNNSIVYTSPTLYGFKFSGSYALGGNAGSVNRGSTWAGAIQYVGGSFGIAAGITRTNNGTPGGGAYDINSTTTSAGEAGVSAVTYGYRLAQAQQRIAVTAGYTFNPSWDISVTYSNVQYIPGINSEFTDTAIFNTVGAVLHWKVSVPLDLGAGASYTRATHANGITSEAQYETATLTQYYALSKRTGLYAVEAYQRSHGQTLGTNGSASVINANATIGDGFNSAPSASQRMFAAGVGIVHRF